jgi:hypothetical protein
VKELVRLESEQLKQAEKRLLHPAPGSRIEAARRWGVDTTLLVEQLRLTPAERASKLERAVKALERVRGAARRPA